MSPTGSPEGIKILRDIQHTLRRTVFATVILYAALGIAVFFSWQSAQATHDSLCAFRADLQHRITQTRTFILQHPEGFAGISASQLAVQADNQQRTVDSLDSLGCEG